MKYASIYDKLNTINDNERCQYGKGSKNKQMAVLNYIHKQVEDHGYPPTVREIWQIAVGLSSTSTVHGHISRLIEQGFLQKDPSKPRALEITQGT